MKLAFSGTTQNDVETLVQMRIAAMCESLERIGRFDPRRARDRFVSTFEPALCQFILADGIAVGFVLLRPADDHTLLDHLYIVPEHQGQGIGSAVLATILEDADAKSVTLQLGALRGSEANRFYQRHGFVKSAESEWDIHYVRAPSSSKHLNP